MTTRAINSAKAGAIGSVGAIAGSIVGGFLPIPANLKAGNLGIATRAAVGIATGLIVGKFADRKIGEQMATGAVTVALHGAMRDIIGKAAPTLNLGGYDESLLGYDESLLGYGDDYSDMSAYDSYSNDMGAYDDTMGYSGAGFTGDADDLDGIDDDLELNGY